MKLKAECAQTHRELCSVCAVQAVHTVCPDNPCLLHPGLGAGPQLVMPRVKQLSVLISPSTAAELLKVACRPVVEYPNLLDRLVRDVAQPVHDARVGPLVAARHVKVMILDPVLHREKLVEIVDARDKLLAQQTLMLPSLSLFDQVNHNYRTSVSCKKLVEMFSCKDRARVSRLDEDWRLRLDLGNILRPMGGYRASHVNKTRVMANLKTL